MKAILMLWMSLMLLSGSPAALADTLTVEPVGSTVMFKVSRFGMTFVTGYFKQFAGHLTFDGPRLERFEGQVEMESLSTGIAARDQDLKSADFFAARQFPQMKIQSAAINQTGRELSIKGQVTIRNITRTIVLRGRATRSATEADLVVQGVIHRRDFNLRLNRMLEFFVGNDVKIFLNLKAVENKEPRAENS